MRHRYPSPATAASSRQSVRSAHTLADPPARLACWQGPVGTGPSPVPPPQQLPEQDIDPNIWSYKPPWCQPVTIVGTGAAFVAGVWAVSGGSAGWTAASAVPIVIWWYLFLGIMPAEFREYAESMNRQRQVQRLNRQREESGEQGGPE